jgi:hypothetical protein
MHAGRSSYLQSFIKKNLLELTDDFFGIFSNKKEDFFYSRSHNEYFTTDPDDGVGPGIIF